MEPSSRRGRACSSKKGSNRQVLLDIARPPPGWNDPEMVGAAATTAILREMHFRHLSASVTRAQLVDAKARRGNDYHVAKAEIGEAMLSGPHENGGNRFVGHAFWAVPRVAAAACSSTLLATPPPPQSSTSLASLPAAGIRSLGGRRPQDPPLGTRSTRWAPWGYRGGTPGCRRCTFGFRTGASRGTRVGNGKATRGFWMSCLGPTSCPPPPR